MTQDIPNDTSDSGMKIRHLAYEILSDRSGKYRKELLAIRFADHDLAMRDKKWLTEVVNGVERRRRTLLRIAKKYSRQFSPRSSLNNILLIGIYQLLFLDKVPAYAAIDTSVQLAKECGHKKQSSYVNAVLRKIQRESELVEQQSPQSTVLPVDAQRSWRFARPIFPDAQESFINYCAVAYSYPTALVQRWVDRFDRSLALQLLQAGNCAPPIILRSRGSLSQFEEQLNEQDIKFSRRDDLFRMAHQENVQNLPGYSQGQWVVTGPTAVEVVKAMDLAPGMKVLDLCAAPGTKAIHIADAMNDSGMVVACDISLFRLVLLPQSMARLGLRSIYPLVIDSTNLPRSFHGIFDRVLVDVPCSNSAVLAKRAEARWRIDIDILLQLQRQQLAMVNQAAKALMPGGIMVYSTCSLESEENEQVIAQFLHQNKNFLCENKTRILPLLPDLDGGTFFKLVRRN